jgi:hypothetical protein
MLKLLPLFFLLSLSATAQDIYIPNVLSGKFTQKSEIKTAGLTLTSEGSFVIDKSKGIKWMVEKPIKSSITLTTGSSIEGGEAAKQVAAIMQSLLVQDYDVLSKYFEVKQTKKRNNFEIRLRTTDETIARVFTQIVITGEKYVKTVAISNRQGDLTTISFTNVKESTEGFFGSE